MRHARVEVGRTEIDRQHPAAHEIALGPPFPTIGDAERLPDQRARPIGADQEVGTELDAAVVLEARDLGNDAIGVRGVTHQPMAIMEPDTGEPLSLPAQHGFDEFLRHAMRQLGGAPGAGETFDQRVGASRGRQVKARQLVAGEAREISDVGRIVGGQARLPDLIREAEPAIMLHRAGLRRIGLRIECRAGLVVHHDSGDAATAELVGQHQAARPAARDEHSGLRNRLHGILPCSSSQYPIQMVRLPDGIVKLPDDQSASGS